VEGQFALRREGDDLRAIVEILRETIEPPDVGAGCPRPATALTTSRPLTPWPPRTALTACAKPPNLVDGDYS